MFNSWLYEGVGGALIVAFANFYAIMLPTWLVSVYHCDASECRVQKRLTQLVLRNP